MQVEGSTPTVLVMDDEPDVRKLVAAIIGGLGYRVLTADSGEHALALHEHSCAHIDLLVADVVPRGMSGPVLAEKLTARQPDLKVLFISGYDRTHVVQKYVLDRGARLLSKPFTVAELTGAVNGILGRTTEMRAAT